MGEQGQEDAPATATEDDHAVARDIAAAAGRLLVELRGSRPDGFDPKQLRDDGDRRSHDLIMELLSAARPDDAVLSEEGRDDSARLQSRRVWIVDPLDGTREFGEPPREDWAVHVALCIDGVAVAGAVALPAQDKVFSTPRGAPALPPMVGRSKIVASRSRAPALVGQVAAAMDSELVYMGSAGAKAMAVLTGDADIYVHAGGQYEWDSAAPVAVAQSAGLHCSRIDGSPLRYNSAEPYLPDLVICRPELAEAVLAAVRASADQAESTGEGGGNQVDDKIQDRRPSADARAEGARRGSE